MADNFSLSPEKTTIRATEKKQDVSKQDSKEIKDLSQTFGTEAAEFVESDETAEFSGDEVSENVKEDKKDGSSGSSAKTGQGSVSSGVQSIVLPSLEIMRTQVSIKIKKEIVVLEKEAAKLMKARGHVQAFKLNNTVGKIRYLRDLLASLTYATLETLKSLWTKYVKGMTT